MSDAAIPAAIAHTRAFVRDHLPRRICRVLEVGCGDGELAASLHSRRCTVIAIDDDAAAVRASRRRGVDARCAHWPEFTAGLFDAIVFARSVHNLDDPKIGIDHAVRQLRPGGKLLIEDFDFAAANAATVMWLHGVASGLVATKALATQHWFLAALLGRRKTPCVRIAAADDVPSSKTIRRLLVATGQPFEAAVTEHLFRYIEPVAHGVQERIRRAEAKLIAAGAIAPLGRRFVLTARKA